jgi:hypothetical protein
MFLPAMRPLGPFLDSSGVGSPSSPVLKLLFEYWKFVVRPTCCVVNEFYFLESARVKQTRQDRVFASSEFHDRAIIPFFCMVRVSDDFCKHVLRYKVRVCPERLKTVW